MTEVVTITRVWDETPEIRCFELTPASGNIQSFKAGSHIDLHLPAKLVRQYSLWNGPDDRQSYLIGVKREPESRGGSEAMHGLALGDSIEISDPKNNFALADEGPAILLAGGIGITPLLSMARQMQHERRDAVLHLFARDTLNTPFLNELSELPTAPVHLGLAPPVLDKIMSGILSNPHPETHLYFCGPGPFMDLVERLALAAGWHPSHIHLERFSVDPETLDVSGGRFEVMLAQSGKTIKVEEGQTIIEAMEEAGLSPLTSCEQGHCGTCMCNVIDGEPDHRDSYLSDPEKAGGMVMMPCVSRSKGKRLVLDL